MLSELLNAVTLMVLQSWGLKVSSDLQVRSRR